MQYESTVFVDLRDVRGPHRVVVAQIRAIEDEAFPQFDILQGHSQFCLRHSRSKICWYPTPQS